MIPELIGRLPVITTLSELDREDLVTILTEPKNSLLKQYKALFEIDEVELDFEISALEAVAEKTLEKKTGARGLRSIMEEILLPVMYQIPSDSTVESVTITAQCINDGAAPVVERNPLKKGSENTFSQAPRPKLRQKGTAV